MWDPRQLTLHDRTNSEKANVPEGALLHKVLPVVEVIQCDDNAVVFKEQIA